MNKKVHLLVFAIILLAASPCYAVGFTDFGPYEGKVVDADTKEPIEGAVVLIEWRRLNIGNTH